MVEKDTVRRGYNEVADAFADRRSVDAHERAVVEQFFDRLPPEAVILDAGCGQGTPILSTVTERYPASSPIGLDIAGAQLDLAADHVPEAVFIQGDLTRLPLASSSIDGAVAFHSLIHLPADQHPHAIEEFARVLRPGGRLLLSEGAKRWEGRNPDWLGTGVEMQWHIAGAPTTKRQIRDAGLTIESETTVSDILAEGEEWVFFEAVFRK
ncbi:MAG: class I SAM-dependent methyltransferase [Halobacteriales archaeon]